MIDCPHTWPGKRRGMICNYCFEKPIDNGKNPAAVTEPSEILSMLKKYRIAASRMCDRWADGDQSVKNELWKALHGLESEAIDIIERAERGDL